MKLTLYCQSKFLTDFYEERPKEKDQSLFSETKVDDWRNFKKMIFYNNIILDIDENKFSELQKHPFWAMLGKKKTNGEITLEFNKFPINYNEVNQHSIFFLSENDECNNLENEYGLLFISRENLYKKSKYLFSHDTFRKIDNKANWDVLHNFKHPCNFILLRDNYLFKKENIVYKNIKILFDTLLPAKINKEFNIKIFTKDPTTDNNKKNDWRGKTKDYLEDYIEKIVKSIRKDLNIKVEITFTQYIDHDRHLITNYFWFSSGYGFVLRNNEKSIGTDIHIHSIASPNVKDRMSELIDRGNDNRKKYN